jgi:hypothetical protein
MSNEQIEKTKSTVEGADHIPEEKKAELLSVLAKLQPAIAKVAQAHEVDAQNIARQVEVSTQAATRRENRPEFLKKVLGKLEKSVEKFEASHPELVEFVTEYSALLSALGV